MQDIFSAASSLKGRMERCNELIASRQTSVEKKETLITPNFLKIFYA